MRFSKTGFAPPPSYFSWESMPQKISMFGGGGNPPNLNFLNPFLFLLSFGRNPQGGSLPIFEPEGPKIGVHGAD